MMASTQQAAFPLRGSRLNQPVIMRLITLLQEDGGKGGERRDLRGGKEETKLGKRGRRRKRRGSKEGTMEGKCLNYYPVYA